MYLALALLALLTTVSGDGLIPEQVHLSYGVTPAQMTVAWLTRQPCTGRVEYGDTRENLHLAVASTSKQFTPLGGPATLKSDRWLHTATINVKPGVEYYYHVGSNHTNLSTWSDLFSFRATKADASPHTAIVLGDLGNQIHPCLAPIQRRAQSRAADAIFHVGDYAYDMADEFSKYADDYMQHIQSAAAYLPYMTCPGNHEYITGEYNFQYNASDYRNRFVMPGDPGGKNLFYSFKFGPATIISINADLYYHEAAQRRKLSDMIIQAETQYNWLKGELERANSLKERKLHPWVIVMGHRPFYCTAKSPYLVDCNNMNTIRDGFTVNKVKKFGLEDLFRTNGVDLYLTGHVHNYERTLPVYKGNVPKAINPKDHYFNPGALVQVLTGGAGNKEEQQYPAKNPPPWAIKNIVNMYSYTTMKLSTNKIFFEQLDQHDNMVDNFIMTKTFANHRPAWLQPKH